MKGNVRLMRAFEESETYWWKCYNCGCNNKVLTNLHTPSGELVGRTLKCCNCGYEFKMVMKPEDEMLSLNSELIPGEQYCIQLRGCPHKKHCPLANKPWPLYPKNKNNPNPEPVIPDKCGCKCENCKYRHTCRFYCTNGKPTKLQININNSPKFL
jgi:hypothetical protein